MQLAVMRLAVMQLFVLHHHPPRTHSPMCHGPSHASAHSWCRSLTPQADSPAHDRLPRHRIMPPVVATCDPIPHQSPTPLRHILPTPVAAARELPGARLPQWPLRSHLAARSPAGL